MVETRIAGGKVCRVSHRKIRKYRNVWGSFRICSRRGVRRVEKAVGIRFEKKTEIAAGKNTWLVVKNTRHLF